MSAGQLGQQNVPRHHDFFRRRRDALQAKPGSDDALVHGAAGVRQHQGLVRGTLHGDLLRPVREPAELRRARPLFDGLGHLHQAHGEVIGRRHEYRLPPHSLFADIVAREGLVRAAGVAHGLRRALAPASRNRIRFEMRRELRRARKQRKREMRAAWRDLRTGEENVA